MNKDKIEVGDLVSYWAYGMSVRGVGLVIDDHTSLRFVLKYRVLWFGTDQVLRHSGRGLRKLEIPNE